jgi:hypothetical protein
MCNESHRLEPKSNRPEYMILDWAKDRFREVPDGQYGLLALYKCCPDLALAASTIASQFGMELKSAPVRTVFRRERGDTVLTRRIVSDSGTVPSSSTRLVFTVHDREVIDIGEDRSTEFRRRTQQCARAAVRAHYRSLLTIRLSLQAYP